MNPPATEPSPPFRPWRVDFARPDSVEYPAACPERPEHPERPAGGWPERAEHPIVERPERPQHSVVASPDSETVARRLFLLLGLAYLFLAALASGLVYTGYFAAADGTDHEPDRDRQPDRDGDRDSEPTNDEEPAEGALPQRPPAPRPPSRDPHAPGLHTRPDGTRYLVMPLPTDIADRFRGQANAVSTASAVHGINGRHAARTARAVSAVPAMGGAAL